MPYTLRSLASHISFTLCYSLCYYSRLDLIGVLCFFLYLAILAIYALLLLILRRKGNFRQYLNPLNAFARVLTLICLSVALPSWTIQSGSCTPDFLRYLFLGTGIIALNFNTLFFPLTGAWQLPIHVATTVLFIQKHSSRTCSIVLDLPPQACDYRSQFAAIWPVLSNIGQSLAGLLYAFVDQGKLEQLEMHGQCQVGVVWLQLCLGGLLPCLLQCALGFDRTLHRFLDELPGLNKVLVYAAFSMQIMGLLWRASYFWGMALLQQQEQFATCSML